MCAVIEQESDWNPWSVRYESGFYARYVGKLYTVGKISATEAFTRSTSWGLMQVMGQVAREYGFAGASLVELCDPVVGTEFGCQVLARKLEARGGDVADALTRYNGGGNPKYAAEVLARVPKYQVQG